MKMCDYCGTRPATVHLVEIVNSKKVELHICEECSNEKKVLISPELALSDLISKYAEKKGTGEQKEGRSARDKVCPDCTMRYSEFNKTQRFGCPGDYEVFEPEMNKLLAKIHGADQHVGVVPGRISGEAVAEGRMLKLKRDLEDAVKNENYEEAASLRDRISRLEAGTDGD